MNETDARLRIDQLCHLIQHPSSQAVALFRHALCDANEEVRYWAVVGLGHYGTATDSQRLLAIVENDTAFVGNRAILALGELGDTTIVGPLATLYTTADRDRREIIVEALARMDDPGVENLLRQAYTDSDITIQTIAQQLVRQRHQKQR